MYVKGHTYSLLLGVEIGVLTMEVTVESYRNAEHRSIG